MHQVEVLLAVDVFELGVPQADHGALVVEGIFTAAEVEAVGGEGRAAVERHVFHARVVARAVAAELAGIQGQALDFFRGDLATTEGLRQRTAVVRAQDRQYRHPFTDFQLGLGQLGFQCHAQAAEVVGGAAVVMHRQQLGVGGTFAAIELDRIQAQYVHAEADSALGETGAGIEDEALGPFFALALRVGRVDEVAVDVEVAQVEAGLGVLHEPAIVGGAYRQGAGNGQQAGQQLACGLRSAHLS